ncbi:uncharacterized protein L969DRAFT_368138 [Mixia osmundae IAM 14324]|uniref:Uncharacterized protein n=1 Tax=Mixia osmundae (strain CBS 9802 / IAM 14324 / JCM 22182 / KY 12970) TaxID=764103 RepID=G7DU44_MIXOS|nr:uncharacterized protein L969DRAFT_368138 [Mixia osmundae IAM 14324]KEI40970.1 hypothetical protein L969DRAFT_368138 [Mixia osmundae IAM 14324]GAA94104.1 hypothetical protein E5Q_00751 [Mixia osmundae IAM 14324]
METIFSSFLGKGSERLVYTIRVVTASACDAASDVPPGPLETAHSAGSKQRSLRPSIMFKHIGTFTLACLALVALFGNLAHSKDIHHVKRAQGPNYYITMDKNNWGVREQIEISIKQAGGAWGVTVPQWVDGELLAEIKVTPVRGGFRLLLATLPDGSYLNLDVCTSGSAVTTMRVRSAAVGKRMIGGESKAVEGHYLIRSVATKAGVGHDCWI